jgi:hydroxymethylglutaryl-CoA reductase
MQVSSWELEEMIQIARRHGALGAKLTCGGGSIIALCPPEPGAADRIESGIREAGYQTIQVTMGGKPKNR